MKFLWTTKAHNNILLKLWGCNSLLFVILTDFIYFLVVISCVTCVRPFVVLYLKSRFNKYIY